MDRNRLIVPITPSAARTPASSRRSPAEAILAELPRLTARDRLLLDLLADHQVLTTDHVAAVAFGSANRARGRLSLLHTRGLLDRFRHYTASGSASWRWTLAPLGAAIVASTRAEPMPRPSAVREATARLATSPTLTHLLTTNGFFVELLAYARTRDGAGLVRWLSEAGARELSEGRVRPDGHGVWSAGSARVPFWLEVDLGTETQSRVVAKLSDYATLAGSRVAFPVLFWLTNPIREANLHTTLARTGIPAGVTVATASASHAAGHDGPAGPVWLIPGHPHRLALGELPAVPPDRRGGGS